jgi:hypothetical protein
MIAWIRKNKSEIFVGLVIWYSVGAIFGIIETINARSSFLSIDDHHYKSGCTYTSLSGLLNPGYVVTCELGRARWNWEPGGKHVQP